jgi:hypothetical protein
MRICSGAGRSQQLNGSGPDFFSASDVIGFLAAPVIQILNNST